eukprot:CAMPEP_0195580728 /NCGR_PEP_ID=MMETSP0814-20130614/18629_2 /TAXON_ID=97485 /ORGANISM="Prymnesium parvum, Strain Texoma1" /LENGTH=246 /DNA_ID=CAMNT_0040717921 /DNA_START=214 /DNA_END=952 /DNA_ORIENTATION=-
MQHASWNADFNCRTRRTQGGVCDCARATCRSRHSEESPAPLEGCCRSATLWVWWSDSEDGRAAAAALAGRTAVVGTAAVGQRRQVADGGEQAGEERHVAVVAEERAARDPVVRLQQEGSLRVVDEDGARERVAQLRDVLEVHAGVELRALLAREHVREVLALGVEDLREAQRVLLRRGGEEHQLRDGRRLLEEGLDVRPQEDTHRLVHVLQRELPARHADEARLRREVAMRAPAAFRRRVGHLAMD